MYVYIQSEPSLWTCGLYDPKGKWQSESDHDTKEQAAERVHWLNGGHKYPALVDEDGNSLVKY